MPRTEKKKQLIEFKGTTMPVVTVSLRSLQADALAIAAKVLFGDDQFFDGDAALFELSHLEDVQSADWSAVKKVFEAHGLHVVGVRGGSDELRQSAAAAGLPGFAASERAPRAAPATKTAEPPPAVEIAPATAPTQMAIELAPAPAVDIAPPPPAVPTLVVDRPLRSGQQVYARGGDLVVLAAVNAGAEVIADGSIHIYAPLRGRALAGASGATGARIFTTRFEAELVSIAGVYRTFDAGVPNDLAGKPAQVKLTDSPTRKPGEASNTLAIEPLQTS
ncbi:MAG: septum site-determining protein MinC [Proteobacteria bacterium]|nr:septum site-determining protein MinC [Pseudomonadota bacterium]